MSSTLADRLDAALAELKTSAAESLRIVADPDSVLQIFIARGDASIYMDADPKRDLAWYLGEFELVAAARPGLHVTYVRDGVPGVQALEGEAPPAAPPEPLPSPEAESKAAA